jgi:glutamate racemase
MSANQGDPRPIGVFDSGIGGLTVVAELRRRLPGEEIVYFGDTARVPYGIKSADTVTRFAREDCAFLLRFEPKLIVVACNTASANALPAIEEWLDVPVCGVVEPGAAAAVAAAEGRTVAVIATEATISSDAYRKAIQRRRPELPVVQQACPLLVPLVEEGRHPDDRVVQLVLSEYLAPLRALSPRVLVLGCTHYPLLKPAMASVLGGQTVLVDSAEQTAACVAEMLAESGSLSGQGSGGKLKCYVSDNPHRFQAVGSRFLGEPITDVVWVSPELFFAETSQTIPGGRSG